jgi:hypothetical protein
MSKTVPELGKTVQHLIASAAQVGVHEFPFRKRVGFPAHKVGKIRLY